MSVRNAAILLPWQDVGRPGLREPYERDRGAEARLTMTAKTAIHQVGDQDEGCGSHALL